MKPIQTFRFLKAGNLDTNPTLFSKRAGVALSTGVENGPTALIAHRTEHRIEGYFTTAARSASAGAAVTLAQAYGSRAEESEFPAELAHSPFIGRLVHRPSVMVRDTQMGQDPNELARQLASTLPLDSWVSASSRKLARSERKRWKRWLQYRMSSGTITHHSVTAGATAVSFYAGGQNRDDVTAALQSLAAGMTGFDLDTEVRPLRKYATSILGLPIGFFAVLASFLVPVFAADAPEIVTSLLQMTGIPALILGVLAAVQLPPGELKVVRKSLERGNLPAPSRNAGRARPPRQAGARQVRDHQGNVSMRQIAEFEGDYPLNPGVFVCGADVFASIASPHGSALSGSRVSGQRDTPPALLEALGPFLGFNGTDRVRLAAATFHLGTAIIGKPNSGKSLLVRALYGWHCMERATPSGLPGHPGSKNAMIAFENKGDGMFKYLEWAHSMGDKALVVDAADPNTPSIDLFNIPGSVVTKAEFMTSALRYVYGDDGAGVRSREAFKSVFPAAFGLTPEIVQEFWAGTEATSRHVLGELSVMDYAHMLLLSRGETVFQDLAATIRAWSVRSRERGTPSADADAAWDSLQVVFDRTPSSRSAYCEAPRNKVDELVRLNFWFAPSRRKVNWTQILTEHRSIIINTGSSPTGDKVTEDQNKVLSSLLMFTLQDAIIRHCSGWLDAGRSVSIFSDELSLLAGSSPEVIAWFRDQGRSYGVIPVLATQRPEQLHGTLRNNLLTYETLISFTQTDVATAAEVAANVGSDFTAEDIQFIEPWHVLVRTSVDGSRQVGVMVKLPNFEAERDTFREQQVQA